MSIASFVEDAHLVSGEASIAVHCDLEHSMRVMQLDIAKSAQVPVWIVALSESQRVGVRMRLDVHRPIVKEASYRTSAPLILVYHQDQTIEFWCRIQRLRCIVLLRLLGVPYLQVPAASLHAIGAEL